MITSPITAEGGTGTVPPAGPQGPSAYDVAVANGFTGTVQQWLASLQGQTADPTALNAAVSRASVQADNAQASATAAAGSVVTANGILATITARISDAVSTAVTALTAMLNAAVSAASGSATASSQSATAAAGSATSAAGSVTSATTQASAASTSASASAGSATAAAGSATAAAGSATAAAGSATTAQNWAMKTGGTVDGASYSAKYYAQQAAASAQAAAGGGITPGGALTQGNFLAAGSGATAVDGGHIGGAAHLDVGTAAGTVAAGNDGRITGALQAANNLSDIPAPAVALAALGGVSAAALSAAIGSSAADLRYLFLRVAAMLNLSLGMVNGAVDPLSDLTHINTAASSGYVFNAAAGTVGLASSVGTTFLTVSTASQAIRNSENSSYPATNAFDGSFSSAWASNDVTSNNGVTYIGQDFGTGNAYAVSQILYYSYNTSGYSVPTALLQYSDNPTAGTPVWTTIQTVTLNGTANTLTVISVAAGAGAHRAWRLFANSNAPTGWAVTELDFQITIPVGSTVSNASQAISDSAFSGYPASQAFDGAAGTRWAANGSGANVAYIGQDFGAGNAYPITGIIFTSGQNTWSQGSVQYSDNPTAGTPTWTPVQTYTFPIASYAPTYLSVPASAGAHRAWRILITGGLQTANPDAAEVQFQIAGTLATVSNAAQAISDSFTAGYPVTNAFDGSYSNSACWQSGTAFGSNANTAWIGQDFGSGNAFALSQIQWQTWSTAGQGPTSVSVQYTDATTPNSSASWTSVGTYTVSTAASVLNTVQIPSSAGAHRAWRVLALNNPTDGYPWAIVEMQMQALLSTQQVSRPAQAISNGDAANAPAFAANDNNVLSAWGGSQTGTGIGGVSYIGQDFGAGNTAALTAFSVTTYSSTNNNVSSAILQYTDAATPNASATWTTVATFALNTAVNTTMTFAVPASAGAHRAWRLLANGNLGTSNNWAFSEASFYAAAPAIAGYVLQSTDFALGLTNPSKAQALVQVDASSAAFTVNTDLNVAVSRCAGVQFTPATLKLVETLPDGSKLYDTGQVDVSGQPSGNTGTVKVTTANGKNIPLTGYIVLEAA